MEEDELLDLVDNTDTVIGTIWRKDTNKEDMGGYLRASELLIINSQGQLWIPRRQLHKRIAPGGLDFSAAGHVASGDNYEDTLARETEEELNLVLEPEKLSFLKKFAPKPGLPPYFRAVYLYRTDQVPAYNQGDFSEYYWLTPGELLDKLRNGELAKESIKETIEYLIEYLGANS